MSSLYTRIAIVRSNMHVAVDVNHVIDIRAGMPEYSADLNIDDVIYINCYMHV